MSLQSYSWYLQRFQQAEVGVLSRGRLLEDNGTKRTLNITQVFNPESVRDRYSPESEIIFQESLNASKSQSEHPPNKGKKYHNV